MAKARARISSDDEWMTHKTTAAYLSVSTQYLYDLGQAGVGPPRRRLGANRWKYLRSDVDTWMLAEPDLSPAWKRQREWYERQKAAES